MDDGFGRRCPAIYTKMLSDGLPWNFLYLIHRRKIILNTKGVFFANSKGILFKMLSNGLAWNFLESYLDLEVAFPLRMHYYVCVSNPADIKHTEDIKMFTEQQARAIDDSYYEYLKNLFVAGKSEQPIPESEQAMLNGIITVDECFMLEMLANA